MAIAVVSQVRDRRKLKRYINHMASKLKPGMYFENCNYEPAVVTKRSLFKSDLCGSDVEGTSLVTGAGCSCSLYHCGPWPLSKEQAQQRTEYLKNPANSIKDEDYRYLVAAWDTDPYTKKLAILSKMYFKDANTKTIEGHPQAIDGLPVDIKDGIKSMFKQNELMQRQGIKKKKRLLVFNRQMREQERKAGFSLKRVIDDLMYSGAGDLERTL